MLSGASARESHMREGLGRPWRPGQRMNAFPGFVKRRARHNGSSARNTLFRDLPLGCHRRATRQHLLTACPLMRSAWLHACCERQCPNDRRDSAPPRPRPTRGARCRFWADTSAGGHISLATSAWFLLVRSTGVQSLICNHKIRKDLKTENKI